MQSRSPVVCKSIASIVNKMKRRCDIETGLKNWKPKKPGPVIICCLCARMGKEIKLISIFSTEGKTNHLHEKIINYTPFKVDIHDGTKQHICGLCTSEINNWHNFIEKCIEAQKKINFVSVKQFSYLQNTDIVTKTRAVSEQATDSKTHNGCTSSASSKSSEVTRSTGTYCIARWCANSTNKTSGISFFRIPTDRTRAMVWLTNAEREDLKTLNSQALHTKYLCRDHFKDNMFMNSKKKKLVWNAVPTLFKKPKSVHKKESQKTDTLPKTVPVPVVLSAQQIIISNFQPPPRQRPIKPKPTNVDQMDVMQLNENTSSVSAAKTSENELTVNAESETRQNVTVLEKKSGSKDVDSLTTDLKTITATSTNIYELPCLESASIVRNDNNSASLSDSRKNTTDSYNFMNDSYLNCDSESLCLEPVYRETNERIYHCGYCGEMFLVKSNLIQHQTTYHSDQPVGCESCGKVRYKSRSEFMEHICDHHNDSTQKS